MSIREQARTEMKRAGYDWSDIDTIDSLLDKFFLHWNSGGAVMAMAPLLIKCLLGLPLSPLTGNEDEWTDPLGDGIMLQNRRCSSVFKSYRNADGEPSKGGKELIHDIDAPNPMAPITFPYDPGARVMAAIARSLDPVVEFKS